MASQVRERPDGSATGVAGEQGPYGHCHEGEQAERAGPADEPPGHVREGLVHFILQENS